MAVAKNGPIRDDCCTLHTDHCTLLMSEAMIEQLGDGEQAGDEALLMGLRLEEGASIERIESLRGRPLNARTLALLREQEMIRVSGERILLSRRGRLVANRIAADLLAAL